MQRLRADPPATLLGDTVTVEDLLPATDGLRWRFANGRVVVRPSGTEPKLKAYLEVVEPSGSAEAAGRRLSDGCGPRSAPSLGRPSCVGTSPPVSHVVHGTFQSP